METSTLIIIVIALAVVLLIVLLATIVLGYKLLKSGQEQVLLNREPFSSEKFNISDEVKSKIKRLKSVQPQSVFCEDHPDLPAIGICSMSNESFCNLCLTEQSEFKIARKYVDLFQESKWEKLHMIEAQGVDANALSKVMKIKKDLWRESSIPLIVQDQFKINIETDEIEVYKLISSRVEDKEVMKGHLSFLNQ